MRKAIIFTVILLSIAGVLYHKYPERVNSLIRKEPASPKPKAGKLVGAYFPNWAQYRAKPYTYTPTEMAPIVSTLTHLFYGFIAFCPPADQPQPYWVTQLGACQGKKPYDLTTLEPKDK